MAEDNVTAFASDMKNINDWLNVLKKRYQEDHPQDTISEVYLPLRDFQLRLQKVCQLTPSYADTVIYISTAPRGLQGREPAIYC